MIARLRHRGQCPMHRSHATGRGKSILGSLQSRNPFLEHANGRVAIARIDELIFARLLKPSLGCLSTFINKALRHENSF